MAFRRRRQADRVSRTGPDSFAIAIPSHERDVLRSLLPQVRELITDPPSQNDANARRLFPTAYPDDAELDREYHHYMRDELVTSRVTAIDDMLANLDATTLTESQLMGWTRSINAIRLVLGTVLDVSEDDPESPDESSAEQQLYHYLTYLLEISIEELQAPAPR